MRIFHETGSKTEGRGGLHILTWDRAKVRRSQYGRARGLKCASKVLRRDHLLVNFEPLGLTPACCTQRCLFGILFNQTEIGLYLAFFDSFGTVNGQSPFAVPNQSVHGEYNLISV